MPLKNLSSADRKKPSNYVGRANGKKLNGAEIKKIFQSHDNN